MRSGARLTLACLGALAIGIGDAQAQLLPPAVGNLPGQLLNPVLGQAQQLAAPTRDLANGGLDALRSVGAAAPTLLDLRRQRLRTLVASNRRVLEADANGNPVRRGEVLAVDPTPALIAAAEAAGFRLIRQGPAGDLGVSVAVLAPPRDSVRDAVEQLRRIAPEGRFEANHVFEPAGGPLRPSGEPPAAASRVAPGPIMAMIDGGVAAHRALAGAAIEQRGFSTGGVRPSGHGTAVASLLVGDDGAFRGAARGARLLVADVYGGDPAAGSAEQIASGLAWAVARGARVVNVSLVGPPNLLIERSIAAARGRGVVVVAAVGNDGPAAPPQYPASYPGVVAVTAVDARDRALPEAGKPLHLDYAAPGADMVAALAGGGYALVRGTSFGAPLAAARLLAAGGNSLVVAAEAVPGRGAVGRGILCKACRVEPALIKNKK